MKTRNYDAPWCIAWVKVALLPLFWPSMIMRVNMNPMAVRVVRMKRHSMVDVTSPMFKPCRLSLPMIHRVACRKVARLVASRWYSRISIKLFMEPMRMGFVRTILSIYIVCYCCLLLLRIWQCSRKPPLTSHSTSLSICLDRSGCDYW